MGVISFGWFCFARLIWFFFFAFLVWCNFAWNNRFHSHMLVCIDWQWQEQFRISNWETLLNVYLFCSVSGTSSWGISSLLMRLYGKTGWKNGVDSMWGEVWGSTQTIFWILKLTAIILEEQFRLHLRFVKCFVVVFFWISAHQGTKWTNRKLILEQALFPGASSWSTFFVD